MNRTKSITFTALAAAIIAVFAQIAIPMSVPITLQTLGVFLAVSLLGTYRGTTAVLLYIAMGAVGLPVFSSFRGGISVLTGATGGYIIGFIPAALTVGFIMGKSRSKLRLTLALALGNLLLYVFGTAWFYFVWTRGTGSIGLSSILSACVLPFLPGDAVKILAAVSVTSLLKGRLDKK